MVLPQAVREKFTSIFGIDLHAKDRPAWIEWAPTSRQGGHRHPIQGVSYPVQHVSAKDLARDHRLRRQGCRRSGDYPDNHSSRCIATKVSSFNSG